MIQKWIKIFNDKLYQYFKDLIDDNTEDLSLETLSFEKLNESVLENALLYKEVNKHFSCNANICKWCAMSINEIGYSYVEGTSPFAKDKTKYYIKLLLENKEN